MMVHFQEMIDKIGNLDITEIDKIQFALNDRKFRLGVSKYSTGKVYGVWHSQSGELAYVGSTIKALPNRWSGHKSFFKNNPYSAYTKFILSQGGPLKFHIGLIEKHACRTRRELLTREKFYINNMKPVCNVSMVDKVTDIDDDNDLDDEFILASGNDSKNEGHDISIFHSTTDISNQVYNKLCEANWNKQLSADKLLQIKKYWYIHHFIRNDNCDDVKKQEVFDAAQDDKAKERLMFFKYAELHSNQSLPLNPYSSKYSQLPDILCEIRKICAVLQIKNTHDTDCLITDDTLLINETELLPSLEIVANLLHIRINDGKASAIAKLRRRVGSCINNFSQTKLKSDRERQEQGQQGGIRKRSSSCNSKIVIPQGFVADIIHLLV